MVIVKTLFGLGIIVVIKRLFNLDMQCKYVGSLSTFSMNCTTYLL